MLTRLLQVRLQEQGLHGTRHHLKHVVVLESTSPSGLHPHVGLGPLPIVRAVVQVLGLDEVQALINLGGLKLDEMQVTCAQQNAQLDRYRCLQAR